MSGIPRQPGGSSPVKRPDEVRRALSEREAKSYGQSAEPPTQEELEAIQQIEDLTDEPVREGEEKTGGTVTMNAWKKKQDS